MCINGTFTWSYGRIINMKKYSFLFIFFVSFASSAEQTFYLNCKVLDQNIFQIKEGKSEKFLSYKNGIKIGETFSVKFNYFPRETKFSFRLTIPGWRQGYDNPIYDTVIVMKSDSIDYIQEQGITFTRTFEEQYLYLSYEGIIAKSIYNTFHFVRYYKNDWQLLFSFRDDAFESYSGTANCMGMPNTYNEVLKIMQKIDQ